MRSFQRGNGVRYVGAFTSADGQRAGRHGLLKPVPRGVRIRHLNDLPAAAALLQHSRGGFAVRIGQQTAAAVQHGQSNRGLVAGDFYAGDLHAGVGDGGRLVEEKLAELLVGGRGFRPRSDTNSAP